MYVINDGKLLELSLNYSSPFCPPDVEEETLIKIMHSALPLQINLDKNRIPMPAELRFLARAIQAVRIKKGRVRITKKTA